MRSLSLLLQSRKGGVESWSGANDSDDDPKVVELYAQWLYCGRILSHDPTLDSEQDSGEPDLLVGAFVFGENIQDAQFRDTVLDALIMYTSTPYKHGERWFPTGSTVRRAYKGTPVGSPLRRLMVDLHSHHGSQEWIKDDCSVDFLVDLVRNMYATRPAPITSDPTHSRMQSCSYHLHSDDGFCYSRRSRKG